jgi:hypothetical protein
MAPAAPQDEEFPDDPTTPARSSPLSSQPRNVAPVIDEPEELTRPILARPSPVQSEDEDGPEFLTAPYLRPPPARPRDVAPPPDEDGPEFLTAAAPPSSVQSWRVEPEDEDGPEFATAIVTHPAARSREVGFEADDPSERPTTPVLAVSARPRKGAPRNEDASATQAPAPRKSGGGLWVAVVLLVLLLGGGATVVALRLDGGLVSSKLFPPPPEAPAPLAKQASPTPPQAETTPADTAAPATPPPSTEAPAVAPQEPTAAAASTPDAGASAPAAGEPSSATVTADVASPEVKPEATEPPEEIEPEAAVEPAQPAKRGGKVAPSTRRKRERTPVDMETSPEVVTNPNEADRAWEALERERSGAAEPTEWKGILTLATENPAKVYLGSRLLGETPLFRVAVPVGKQTLRIVGADGKPQRFQVDIKAGEITSVRVPREKLAGQ